MKNAQIYNNTIYVPAGNNATIVEEGDWGGDVMSAYFWNNIFYILGDGGYSFMNGNIQFDNNIFYGNHPASEPDDPHKITDDPLLVNPGSGGTGLGTVGGYQLQAGSPAIQAGMRIADNGGRDYYGNTLPQNCPPDIGAHQYYDGPDDCPVPPTATPDPSAMHVEDIYTTDSGGAPKGVFTAGETIYWQVLIKNGASNPVEGAEVTCAAYKPNTHWSNKTETTGADGWAYFSIRTTKAIIKGTYTFYVTDVVKSGQSYDPDANVKDMTTCEVQ